MGSITDDNLKTYYWLKTKSQNLPLSDTRQTNLLSANKVTGWSLNFPIYSTCQPSKVCIKTCYALSGPVTWSSSINKQKKNEYFCKESPSGFADSIINECSRLLKKDSQFFLRWNGTGDLFEESVESLLLVSDAIPNLPIWVVTRIPKYAYQVISQRRKNIFIHFSLDKESLNRQNEVLSLLGEMDPVNLFFSYQCDKNEDYSPQPCASVVFLHQYKSRVELPDDQVICPLNLAEDITNTCYKCRRCFNGDAVKHASDLRKKI